MNDSRIDVFRAALDALIGSLDAVIRIECWSGPESVPEPLLESARQIVTRLGAANRLAGGRFAGSIADSTRVAAIASAVRRLDAAYVTYVTYCRGHEGSAAARDLAARALEAELVDVRAAR